MGGDTPRCCGAVKPHATTCIGYPRATSALSTRMRSLLRVADRHPSRCFRVRAFARRQCPTHIRVSMHCTPRVSIALLHHTSNPPTPQAWDDQPSPRPARQPQRGAQVSLPTTSHAPRSADETRASRGRGSGLVPWSQLLRRGQLPPRACWATAPPAASAVWWACVAAASGRAWPGCCGRSRPARTPHPTTWTTRRRTTAVDTPRGWRRSPSSRPTLRAGPPNCSGSPSTAVLVVALTRAQPIRLSRGDW